MSISPTTQTQIDVLDLDPARPLVLCDVDEVVVHFLRGFEAWLDRNGLWLDPASFALNGNIRHKHNHAPLEEASVGPAIMGFFEDMTHELELIDGAAYALNDMSADASVVMLTNIPSRFRDARIENLKRHGLHFPLVTNSGLKGPAVSAIAGGHTAPVVFIDDHTGYLKSASEQLPATTIVHFMQDERFGRHVPREDFVHHRTDNWADAHGFIKATISSAGERQWSASE